MSNASWPKFSFTEILKPPEGWATDHAILSTYSADLIVIVTSLLALRGYDLDGDRPSSRVELVRAIEGLRGRVRILAQKGRVPVPSKQLPFSSCSTSSCGRSPWMRPKARWVRPKARSMRKRH